MPSQWNDFWQEVERQKFFVMPLAKEERSRLVELALASVRIPSADGRRWLYDAEREEGDDTSGEPAGDESRMVEYIYDALLSALHPRHVVA